jgi:hypothetical protein
VPWRFLDAGQLSVRSLFVAGVQKPAHKRSFRLFTGGRAIVAWRGNNELGEFAQLSFDVDPAAMLLYDDVVGHREAEPRPFPGWLGGKVVGLITSRFGG